MSATYSPSGLPDPELHAEFYADVTTKRFMAWVIDTILTVLICAVIVPFTAFTALFFLPALYLVVNLIYRIVTLAGRSATPGMRFMAIEFRDRDGKLFDAGYATLHTLGYAVSVAMVPLQLVSIVLMLISPRGQGLTDHVLGTAAVNRAAQF